MEQCSPFSWVFYNDEEGMMGELRQYLIQSRMELEATVLAAQEEIMKKEEELTHLRDVLMLTIKERDEAQSKFQQLMVEKLLIQQQLQQQQQQRPKQQKAASMSNTNTTTNCFSTSSSESEESSSIISSPCTNSPALQQQPPPTLLLNVASPPPPLPPQIAAILATSRRPFPEKGKLLKAVMEAGPLLQTFLLAGPLPQWQHPPPQLDSIEIPLVTINPSNSPGKRGVDNLDCSIISSPKYQRVV